MIISVLVFVIAIFLGQWYLYKDYSYCRDSDNPSWKIWWNEVEFADKFIALFLWIAIGVVIFLALGLIFSIAFSKIPTEMYVLSEKPIYALNTSNGLDEGFFFGTGTSKGRNYYYYVTHRDIGGYINKIEVNKYKSVKIIESNESPNVRVFSHRLVEKYRWLKLVFPFTPGGWDFKVRGRNFTVITIPPNSAKYDFNVDLSNL